MVVEDCDYNIGKKHFKKLWAKCLQSHFNNEPPLNFGLLLGRPGFLAEIYNKAAVYGVLMGKNYIEYCTSDGGIKHLLTASIRFFESRSRIIVLPNSVDSQVAS